MPKETTIVHGPWSGVRSVSDPGEESATLLYDALNCAIPDPVHGSGVAIRPPFLTLTNPLSGVVGQAVHDHTRLDGTIDRYLVRGGKLLRWDGSLTAPVFTDVTPATIAIATTGRVYLTSFADKLVVNDGVNVPWVFTPSTGAAALIPYGTPTNLLSISLASNKKVAVAASVVTIGGVTATRSDPAVTLPTVVVTANLWGIFRIQCDAAGTITAVAPTTPMAYATEAAAKVALPVVPAGSWDLGYLTVQAPGLNWDSSVSNLTGVNALNFYAPAYSSWTAYGQPVVYSAQLVLILNQVLAVSARATIAWSEINNPSAGYGQANYDNTWSLTQTSTDSLYALAATDAALYYLRRESIGEITGNISRAWRTEATLDAVSTSIGTTIPASVLIADGYVWFLNGAGLPFRFQIGSRSVEPLWLDLRDVVKNAPAGTSYLDCGTVTYHPELRLVVFAIWCASASVPDTASTLYLFSAETGKYQGRWQVGSAPSGIDALGVLRDSASRPLLIVLGPTDASTLAHEVASRGAVFAQRRTADVSSAATWSDNGGITAVRCSVTTHPMLDDAGRNKRYDRLRARVRCAESRTFDVQMNTPGQTGIMKLTPTLSAGVADDKVLHCGLATTARWVQFTIAGPITTGGILQENGDGILTESGLRLSFVATDSPLSGPIAFESVEVRGHAIGSDRVVK